jgi:hypothetical protein
MGNAIDAQLTFKVVAAAVDKFAEDFTISHNVAYHDCVFFAGCSIYYFFTFKRTCKLYWLENSLFGIFRIDISTLIRKLLHRVKSPSIKFSTFCNSQRMAETTYHLNNFLFNLDFNRPRTSFLLKR